MIDSILGLALLLAAAPARAEGTPVEQDARQCYQLAESDPARAVGFCTRAIQSGQLAPAALANAFDDRCWARGNIGQYDLAIADCDAALKLSPQAPFAFGNRGTAYLHQGQYERTIADYDRSIALFATRNSDDAEFYFGRAIAYSRLGQKERAEADSRRAGGLARPAAQAKVEMPLERWAQPYPALGGRSHEVDAPARRVHLLAEHAIGRALGQADPTMHALADLVEIEPFEGTARCHQRPPT